MKLRIANLRPRKKAIALILKIGVPSSIGQGVSALGFTVLQGVVNSFGTAVISAFGVGNRIIGLFNMPAMGFSRATAVLVGQRLGAKDRAGAWEVIKLSVVAMAVFITAGMTFAFFRGASFIYVFINDAEVIAVGERMFRIVSPSIIFFTLYTVAMGALQGAGDTRTVMYLNVGRLWLLRVPLAYLLARVLTMGPVGIWWSMFASNLLVAVAGFYVVSRGKWMDKLNPDDL